MNKSIADELCTNCKRGVSYKWGGKVRTLNGVSWLRGLDGRQVPVEQIRLGLNYRLTNFEAVIMKTAAALHLSYLLEDGMRLHVDFAPMLHVHDEAQFEFRTRDLAERGGTLALLALKTAGERWGSNIRIDGEYKIGTSWADCH